MNKLKDVLTQEEKEILVATMQQYGLNTFKKGKNYKKKVNNKQSMCVQSGVEACADNAQ